MLRVTPAATKTNKDFKFNLGLSLWYSLGEGVGGGGGGGAICMGIHFCVMGMHFHAKLHLIILLVQHEKTPTVLELTMNRKM